MRSGISPNIGDDLRKRDSRTAIEVITFRAPWMTPVSCYGRRKLHGRNSTITDPIIVETAIVDALQSYVEVGLEEVCCVVAKFLDAFMHHAALVETFEVDNFVLRNGSALCTW